MNLHKEFWNQLDSIQSTLLLDDVTMGEMFDLSALEFKSARKSDKSLSLEHLDILLDRAGLSIDSFFEGTYDSTQVRKKFFGDDLSLPERYTVAKYSKARTIINCLTFIELKFGTDFKNSVLRTLQLDVRFFDDPERELNINLLRDLCNLLLKLGMKSKDFINMGRMSYQVNRTSTMGEAFGAHKRVDDLMADICENHSVKFDKNFDYFITHKRRDEISIGSRPSERVLEHLSQDEIGSEEICLTKLGVFGSFPLYLNKVNSHALKTKCMRSGDPYYEYTVKFS